MADDPIVCEWCGEDIPDGKHVQFDGAYMHSECATEARLEDEDDEL